MKTNEIKDEANHLANLCPGANHCGLCSISQTRKVLCRFRYYDRANDVYECHKPEKVYVALSQKQKEMKQQELELVFKDLPKENYVIQ